MAKRCEHADIQPVPCAGSVNSRAIRCKVGQANACLQNCNEKCPAYKMVVRNRTVVSTSAVRRSAPAPAQRSGVASQGRTSRAAANTGQPRVPCGNCGKNIQQKPNTNKSW